MLFVPIITGLFAVAFGVSVCLKGAGARDTDRAFGVAGVALGLVNVIGWSVVLVLAL
jgi:hypothetical protein